MAPGGGGTSIDELLDRAVRALNEGDRATATALAGQVLAVDRMNAEAGDLLTAPPPHYGEIRRLTIMFADLVDSTALSTRLEPETYRTIVGRYRDEVSRSVERYEGHISSIKGDGLLAVFGHPRAHENDVERAVAAGLDITRAVTQLSERAQRKFGVAISVRVGIHRGIVYLDTAQDDVYGFAANLTARICSVAEPGTVAVSDTVAPLVRDAFDLRTRAPVAVKGVEEPVHPHQVLGERPDTPAPGSPPLIGRDRERSWLHQSCQRAQQGALSAAGVVFRGEPGIGKTRLAAEAADIVAGSGGSVVELRGSPLHTDAGLHPVRRLAERRCGITRLTDAAERLRLLENELEACALDPVSTVPLIAPVLGIGPEHGYRPAALEGRALYESIGQAVHRYVLACLAGAPGLVIAEDAHWFDPSTMELLTSLLASADGRLLVMVTGRDGDWLPSGWPATVFELAPLTDEQSDALIDALDSGVSAAQRAAVRHRCDGVPFYIERVVAGLDEAGRQAEVPEALYEPLLARLRSRGDVVPVVEAAAVIGRAGDLPLLQSVIGRDVDDVDDVISELVRANVLERRDGDGWRFRHELLREVAAELAPPSLRRELHSRAAHALVDAADVAEPDWRLVATHFERANRHDEAVEAYRKASLAARRRGAVGEAVAHLTTALTQLAACPPGPPRDRTEIAIRLARGVLISTTQASSSGDVPAEFQRCLELASAGNHEDELFTTLMAMVSYYLSRGELRRAHEVLDSLSARVSGDRAWSGLAIASTLGAVIWMEGEFDSARDHLVRALADQSAVGARAPETGWWSPVDPISSAQIFLALTHMVGGDLDRADTAFAESIRRCEKLAFPQNAHNRAHTYFMQIWVKLESGQLPEATVLVTELRSLAEASGLDLWRLVGATQQSAVKALTALDADADAETLAARAEKLARLVDGARLLELNSYLTFHDAIIGRLLIGAGQPERARDRLDASLRHAEEIGMRFNDAEVMRVRAHTLTTPQERRDALHAGLELARRQGATLFELRCSLDLFELTEAGDHAQLAETVRRFAGDDRWPEVARAQALLARGRDQG